MAVAPGVSFVSKCDYKSKLLHNQSKIHLYLSPQIPKTVNYQSNKTVLGTINITSNLDTNTTPNIHYISATSENTKHSNSKPQAFIEYEYAVYQCAPCEQTWAILIDHSEQKNKRNNTKKHQFKDEICPKCKDSRDKVSPCKTGCLEGYSNGNYHYFDKNGIKWQRIYAAYQCSAKHYDSRLTWTSNNIWMAKIDTHKKNQQEMNNISNVIDKNCYYSIRCNGFLMIFDNSDCNSGDACNHINCFGGEIPRNMNEKMLYKDYKNQVLKMVQLIKNTKRTEELVPMNQLEKRLACF